MEIKRKVSVFTEKQKKELLNKTVDGKNVNYSPSVNSHRSKLINEGYLTSKNQVQTFDDLLNGIEKDLKTRTNLSDVLFKAQLLRVQTEFVANLVKLFNEGWKVVKAFNYYTDRGNTYKYDVLFDVVLKQDKKDFEKLGFINAPQKQQNKPYKPKKIVKREVVITKK